MFWVDGRAYLFGMSRHTHITADTSDHDTTISRVDESIGGTSGEAPVRLPQVWITVEQAGTLAVTVDGEDFPAPEDQPPWGRADLGALLDAVTKDRSQTVRVEICEIDGSTFTDIIGAAPRRRQAPTPEKAEETMPAAAKQKPLKKSRAMRAEGFDPGESVAVAVVVSEATAGTDGTAEMTLPKGRLKGAGTVILYGRASGRTKVRGLS